MTCSGKPVRVIDAGQWNAEGGPDFRGAMVQIGDGPAQTGTEDCIDDKGAMQIGAAESRSKVDLDTHLFCNPVLLFTVGAEHIGLGEQYHFHMVPLIHQVPGRYKSISPIVPGSAKKQHLPA